VRQTSPARHCPPRGECATSLLAPLSRATSLTTGGGGRDGRQVSSVPPPRQGWGVAGDQGAFPRRVLSPLAGEARAWLAPSAFAAEQDRGEPATRPAVLPPWPGFKRRCPDPTRLPKRAAEWAVGSAVSRGPQAVLWSSLPGSENRRRGTNQTSLVAFCIPNSLRAQPRTNPTPGGL